MKDIEIAAIEEFNNMNPVFPVKCSICENKLMHLYFHRHDERHAGGWAWCSECKANQHFSFLIPEWWSNLTCISIEELGGTFPTELDNFKELIDEHMNDALRAQKPKADLCCSCVYKKAEETIELCPNCNNSTLHFRGDGSGCNCSNCGYGWATSPMFPPCQLDEEEYTIIVNSVDKTQYMIIAKLMSCNVVDVKKRLDAGLPIEIRGQLFKVAKIVSQLEELGVDYKIEPNLFDKYYDIRTCKF